MRKDDRLLTIDEVVARIPFSRVHIYRLMKRGEFPQRVRVCERRVAWRESEIREYIESRPRADLSSPVPERP